ncbi:uncharacterized protein LOC132871659 [Neoarius graeffei]|uniref:uncharacterized protein LOC132871659 n=1 Tax=Neoarius graeffei TaxID=443677 RepID=UPI00298BF256|nr:uncharacterized protein LOC132871659 [Neoarius graeffei]
MAGRRLAFYSPSTPVPPVPGCDGPVSGSLQTDERKLLSALSGLSLQIAELTTFVTDRFNSMDDRFNTVEDRFNTVEDRLTALEGRNFGENANSRKKRRVQSPMIAETVCCLHNSETNTRRYEPAQGLTLPHNEAVTSYLVRALSTNPNLHDADKDNIVSACKTYYETLSRSYRYQQPDLSLQVEAMKKSARSRSRRKRLFDARRGVLAMDEMDVWQCATIDLMSDEEDGVVDGVSGWIVKPLPSCNPELSELCATLQSRLEADPKYRATHHRRLHVGPMPPAPHSSETTSMHFTELQD